MGWMVAFSDPVAAGRSAWLASRVRCSRGSDWDVGLPGGGRRDDGYSRVDQAVGRSGRTDDAIARDARAGDGQVAGSSEARAADGEWR